MGKNKEKELKDFLISSRKKIPVGMTNAPFWIVRKKGERIWNRKQKRHWRTAEFGGMFKKHQRSRAKMPVKGKAHFKKGKKNRERRVK